MGRNRPLTIRAGPWRNCRRHGRGAALAHLDLVAERIVRAAYTRLGDSEAVRTKIGTGDTKDVKYGEVLNALGNVAKIGKAAAPLQTLHALRSDKTELTHDSGAGAATEADATTGRTAFISAAKILVGALEKASAATT